VTIKTSPIITTGLDANGLRILTPAEDKALRDFAARHGRSWKSALRDAWYYASEPGLLHALRNDPRWSFDGLDKFKL
jgi:hypothetical protein